MINNIGFTTSEIADRIWTNGDLVYNKTTSSLDIFNGITWVPITTGPVISGGLSTGIISGGALTINSNNTLFDVAAGSGYIVNTTVFPVTTTLINFPASIGNSVTNLLTAFSTDIAINAAGSVVQQSSFSGIEQRSVITLGGLDHSNQTNIINTFVLNNPVFSVGANLRELARIGNRSIISNYKYNQKSSWGTIICSGSGNRRTSK